MDPRRIAMLITFCLAVMGCISVPGFALVGQDLQPISDRSRRIEIQGMSVLPPQGEDWFLFPVSPQEGIPENTLIRFVKRLPDAPPWRSEDARQVFAAVSVLNSGKVKSPTPVEFLEDFKGEFFKDGKIRTGEMITSRQRLTGFDAALDDSLGAICVRYSRLTEVTGQFRELPDLVAISSTRGLICSHPHWPQFLIDVTYQQVYAKGQAPLSLDAESDIFLKSILFTSVQPVSAMGPKELYSSHMQAGVLALKGKRWSEAEVSFQAALKAAEYFGPKNPAMAMTLYYLGSTQEQQGRPADAELLLRRALDIFETQSGAADLEVASVFGQTLNDLAVIYARRASTATPPSSDQALLKEAERLLQRALAIREKSDPSQVGRTLSNLTQLYFDSGRWSEATVTAQRAVLFYERQRGPEDQGVVFELDRLADIYLQQGRLAEAEPVVKRVVSGMEKTLGPNHPAIARRLESYAAGLRRAGRDAEAKAYETRAQAIRRSASKRP